MRDDIEAELLWDAVQKYVLELRAINTSFTSERPRSGYRGDLDRIRTPRAWSAARRNYGWEIAPAVRSTYQETPQEAVRAWLRGDYVDDTGNGQLTDTYGRLLATVAQGAGQSGSSITAHDLREMMADVPEFDQMLATAVAKNDVALFDDSAGNQRVVSAWLLPEELKKVQQKRR